MDGEGVPPLLLSRRRGSRGRGLVGVHAVVAVLKTDCWALCVSEHGGEWESCLASQQQKMRLSKERVWVVVLVVLRGAHDLPESLNLWGEHGGEGGGPLLLLITELGRGLAVVLASQALSKPGPGRAALLGAVCIAVSTASGSARRMRLICACYPLTRPRGLLLVRLVCTALHCNGRVSTRRIWHLAHAVEVYVLGPA
jgi:hypothetical protein